MSVGFLFILIALILLVSLLVAAAKGERLRSLLGPMLGIGLMLLVGLVLFVGFFVSASYVQVYKADRTSHPPLAQLPNESNAGKSVVTNEQLWNRLTESRINLDEEQQIEPPAQPEPKGRPDWVDTPPKRVGNVYQAVVASDPFSTVDECFDQLEHRFPGEVQKRLTKLVPSDQRSLIGSETLGPMGITLDYIMREICREQFTQIVESSVGEMKQVYVLMEFTPAVESHLEQSWQTYQRRFRLVTVGKIAGIVLATLAFLYGLLQIDTWTRGYYTRQLLWGVPAAIIAIAAVVLFVA